LTIHFVACYRPMMMFLSTFNRLRAFFMATEVSYMLTSPLLHVLTWFFDEEPAPELIAQLAQETYNTDLLLLLVQSISRFEFEARKDVVQIFNNLLRRQIGSRWPTVEYLAGKPDIVFAALAGYENEEVALNTGMVLKEILRHEQLCKILLYSDQ